MSKHMLHEVENLKKKILALAAVVEDAVHKAVESVEERNAKLAQEIIDADVVIDHTEVDIEEDCLKILALYQPVATDLRFVITVLKINNDIERVADLAVNIAERAAFLCTQPPIEVPFRFAEMKTKALAMLSGTLDALMHQDSNRARQICTSDEEVDTINREMYSLIFAAVRKNPNNVESLLSYLSVSRHLERIADYATNVAEDVIYMCEGQIVRHHSEEPRH